MIKRLLSLAVAILMTLGVFGISAYAADAWNGRQIDIEWYQDGVSEFEIGTAAELAGLAQLVNDGNNFSKKTITMTDDIDLGGYSWTPIGNSTTAFSGIFDGGEHVISGLYIQNPELEGAGLFGRCSAAKISNVVIDGADISAQAYIAAVAGNAYTSDISNCKVIGTVQLSGHYDIGTITGYTYGDVVNCTVTAEEGSYLKGSYKAPDLEGDNVGGIVGFLGEGSGTIVNSSVTGLVISGVRKVGSILGFAHHGTELTDCNVSDISIQYNGENVPSDYSSAISLGGIVGEVMGAQSDVLIKDVNLNDVTVTAKDGAEKECGIYVGTVRNASTTEQAAKTVTLAEVSYENSSTTGTSPFNEDLVAVAMIGDKGYTNLGLAIDAVQSDETIVLMSDVTVYGKEAIRSVVNIDLNGHNIAFAPNSKNDRNYFLVVGGTLNLTGSGMLYEKAPYYSPILVQGSTDPNAANYSVVKVGENVVSKGWSGLFIDNNNYCGYGVDITVNGTLISVPDVDGADGHGLYINGSINKKTGNVPKILLDGATLESSGDGMYLAGYADTTIKNSTITAPDDGCLGIEIRAGKLVVENSTITGGSGEVKYDANGNGTTSINTAITVSQHTTKLPIDVDIISGTFTGGAAFLQINPQDNELEVVDTISLNIEGGNFDGDVNSENFTKFVSGGSFTDSQVSKYISDGAKLTTGANGMIAVVKDDNLADTIAIQFEKVSDDDNSLYNIVAEASDNKTINRLTSAQLSFVNSGSVGYEILPYGKVNVSPDLAEPNTYLFYFNGSQADESGTKITIGQVKFKGYGTVDFKVEGADNAVHATAFEDNIVTDYIVDGGTGENIGTLDLSAAAIQDTLSVPAHKLTVNITFPNAVSDNAAAYQDMQVTISGGDLTDDLSYALGTPAENTVIAMANGQYTVETDLTENTIYTVTVSGAGYRTARYTVTMTEDKTLTFWNNVKDEATVVETGNDASKVKTTFLAGDILQDNQVNLYDLSAVVSYFGEDNLAAEHPEYAKYDLNRDGKIDSKDVAMVLVSWGY